MSRTDSAVTTVTHESWGTRLKNSCGGIVIGIILVVVSFPVLIWNEGRAVERHKILQEGARIVVSAQPDTVDASNAGRLVHLTGTAEPGSASQAASDPIFGVSPHGALRLRRRVEMYQWVEQSEEETRKTAGGGKETTTTYSYDTEWRSNVVDSGTFYDPTGHVNPTSLPYPPNVAEADPITVGAYRLPEDMVQMMRWYVPVPSTDVALDKIEDESAAAWAAVYSGGFYLGAPNGGGGNPSYPQVGDARVTFDYVPTGTVSILAAQNGDTFEPYYSSKFNGNIFIVYRGSLSAGGMFQRAERENVVATWLLRLAGFVLMFVGFSLVLKPASVLADVVPLLGNIVECGTDLVAFLVAAILSAVVIALAWLAYRPLVAATILAVVGGLAYFAYTLRKKEKLGGEMSYVGAVGGGEGQHYPNPNLHEEPPLLPSYQQSMPPPSSTASVPYEHVVQATAVPYGQSAPYDGGPVVEPSAPYEEALPATHYDPNIVVKPPPPPHQY